MRWGAKQAAAAGLALLAPGAVLAVWFVYGERMPDPLPTHWNMSGQVDGTTDRTLFFTVLLAATTVFSIGAVAGLLTAAAGSLTRELVVATSWVSWLLAAVFADVAIVSAEAVRAQDAEQTWGPVAATVLAPFAVAALTWVLLPPPGRSGPAPAVPESAIDLPPNARVTWVGQARSPRVLMAAVGTLFVAVALVLTLWQVTLVLLVVAVAIAWAHVVTVRVDTRGVRVSWGPVFWPRTTIALAEIAAARVEDINPLDWGGWGYRVTARGRAYVVRKGPGIVLERHERPALAVTVDEPDAAVELVNALVARAHRLRQEGRARGE